MNLNHFGVTVLGTLLVADRDGTTGVDDRVGRFSEDQSVSTSRHDDGVGGECFDFHRPEVLRGDASASALGNL